MRICLLLLSLAAPSASQAQTLPWGERFFEALRDGRLSFPKPLHGTQAKVAARLEGSEVPRAFIDGVFADPRLALDPAVPPKVERPAESLPYEQYRKIFMTEARIAGGAAFIAERRALIDAVAARYGVDAPMLAAILGLETFYGRSAGGHHIVNALYTIAEQIPARADFAVRELAELLRLCHSDRLDPFPIRGSYAGAFGYAQFIPSTFNRHAVDYDGDGLRSFSQWPDVLATEANYISKSGYSSSDPDRSEGSRNWKAIYAYNHSANYVNVAFELRAAILSRKKDPGISP